MEIKMELREKIKSLFHEQLIVEKILTPITNKKKIIKNIGRKGLKKSKIKGKRKNNFKTQDARRILASKHGISDAIKKIKNAYVMTYAEIAKLMRDYHYSFNKDHGKWFRKKDTETSSPSNTNKIHKPKENGENKKKHSKGKIRVSKPEDISDKLKSTAKSSVKSELSNGIEGNTLDKESMKSYQARILGHLLNKNTQEGGWLDAIQMLKNENGVLEFYLPKDKIYEFLASVEIFWINERNVWVDSDGNYPIPDEVHGGRYGITGRSVLANIGFVNFIDVDNVEDQEVLDTLKELEYNWVDGEWKKPETPTKESLVQKRIFPELVTKDIIGHI